MRRDVQELYGVPREKIRVIHNGIDLNQYRPTEDPAVLAKHYTHYNVLRTVEDNFGLEPLTANDREAEPIAGIWK